MLICKCRRVWSIGGMIMAEKTKVLGESHTTVLLQPPEISHGLYIYIYIQGDQNVSVHLMITIQKVTSNVQRVPRRSPDIY
jgi:hypothetical protein